VGVGETVAYMLWTRISVGVPRIWLRSGVTKRGMINRRVVLNFTRCEADKERPPEGVEGYLAMEGIKMTPQPHCGMG
jgi:hypothetical protein